jgi:hypothetical protein
VADRRSEAELVFRSIQALSEGRVDRANELFQQTSMQAVLLATLAVGQQLAGFWSLSPQAAFAELGKRLASSKAASDERRAAVLMAEYLAGLEPSRAVDTQAVRKGGPHALAGLLGLCEAGGEVLAGDRHSVADVCDSLVLEVALVDARM